METFYFTFGFGQLLANHYIVVEAESSEDARLAILGQFGRHWSFQYTQQQWTEHWVNSPNDLLKGLKSIGTFRATSSHVAQGNRVTDELLHPDR
jgi:hypothetical protein